jgi:glycosyltransferase involved in cell wall biosynthesis
VLPGLEYAIRLVGYAKSWRALISANHQVIELSKNEWNHVEIKLSVVVAFRNEAKNLRQLLVSLKNQSLSGSLFEVILVDDHSTDDGIVVLNEAKQEIQNLILAKNSSVGKKAAVETGIKLSKGEIIVATDADCLHHKEWLAQHLYYHNLEEVKFISGPVRLFEATNAFERWQQLEFAGLNAIGAASIFNKTPDMCHGANISYKKKVFYEVGGFEKHKHIPSGDDQLLMHEVFHLYPEGLFFIPSEKALVETAYPIGLKGFYHQRIRWISKMHFYQQPLLKLQLYSSFLFLSAIAFFGIMSVMNQSYLAYFISLFLIKTTADYIFYSHTLSFYRLSNRKRFFLISELVHIIYILSLGILSLFVTCQWKDRKI